MRVNEIETMYERQCINVKIEQGSTLIFLPDLPYIVSILNTRIKFTCIYTKNYTTVQINRKREKNNNKAKSFFRLNFNVYINMKNREKARARNKKTTENNFVGRKTWKFYSGGEKMRNASGHQGENKRQWKEKGNRKT